MISLERGLPRELHSLLNQLKQLYTMELIQSKCKPVFQHEYCLAQLSAAGYKIGVASNSVRRSVEVMMERANLARYLDLIVSNEDVVNAKPDPEIYRVAMERLGVTPDETVVVEDNEHGVRSAQAAGTHVKVVGDPSEVSWTSVSSFIGTVEARVA
jgi:HAD superfamily hydrolase (TIGR01509 family)